jgi:hypothetical protein
MTPIDDTDSMLAVIRALDLIETAAKGDSVRYLNLTLMVVSNVLHKVAIEGRMDEVVEVFNEKLRKSMKMIAKAEAEGKSSDLEVGGFRITSLAVEFNDD